MRLRFIPFFFLVLPLLEIAAFVAIGSRIGVLATIGLVFASAIVGLILLRIQGFGVLDRIRRESEAGRVPGRELAHGLMILIAGILLLIPGFITDAIGFLLFVPAVRDFGWSLIRNRVVASGGFASFRQGPRAWRDGRTIDLGEEDYRQESRPGSPWRRIGDD